VDDDDFSGFERGLSESSRSGRILAVVVLLLILVLVVAAMVVLAEPKHLFGSG
jgi:hypothetical protein